VRLRIPATSAPVERGSGEEGGKHTRLLLFRWCQALVPAGFGGGSVTRGAAVGSICERDVSVLIVAAQTRTPSAGLFEESTAACPSLSLACVGHCGASRSGSPTRPPRPGHSLRALPTHRAPRHRRPAATGREYRADRREPLRGQQAAEGAHVNGRRQVAVCECAGALIPGSGCVLLFLEVRDLWYLSNFPRCLCFL
jgi:hypothetical protein